MDSTNLLLPSYLQSLGYAEIKSIRELAARAVSASAEVVQHDTVWSQWRGILDYISCVEYARNSIKALPACRAIGSVDVVPARYHSASLVFFAQATLDNVAVWTHCHLKLNIKGGDCAFHKAKFLQSLSARTAPVAKAAEDHMAFIGKLENFRKEWIHRLAGGAQIFSDKVPSEPNARIQIMVPINPSIGQYSQGTTAYLKAIARSRTNNGGRWLYPVGEFADEMANGLKAFLVSYLEAALVEPLFQAA